MPYQTGTAANPAALKTTVETFAQANGWTLSSNVLSKGISHIRLTAVGTTDLKIEGADSANFSSGVCGQFAKLRIDAPDWPVTFHLFAWTDPELIFCVTNYNVTRVQWLAFGEMAKNGTWTGGNWFAASHGQANVAANDFSFLNDSAGDWSPDFSCGAPWWGVNRSISTQNVLSSFVHCEIDGFVWPGVDGGVQRAPDFVRCRPLHERGPNQWNGQAVLLPFWLWLPRSDNYHSLIGHLGHVRSLRITHHDLGDVIQIGAERWKVFPWILKDPANPNGQLRGRHSGTFGFAVRYDGP
jgi:hypothetical protein